VENFSLAEMDCGKEKSVELAVEILLVKAK